jgi:ATP-dependent Clp protease protease subunit
MKTWYTIKNNQASVPEIVIYDEIGMWGVTAADFARDVRALGDVQNLTLRINSPGGSVFDALAIYNTLRRHPANVTGYVDGIAASAASVIAMAADKLIMPANTFLMIHDPSGVAMGTAEDMRDMSDILDRIKTALVSTYERKVGDNLSTEDIAAMLADESWLTAEEAVGFGFADEIEDAVQIAALSSLERFKQPPQALAEASQPPPPVAIDPVEPVATLDTAALVDRFTSAHASQHLAALLKRDSPVEEADVEAELQRIQSVRDICVAAELDDPDRWIASGLNAEQMQAVATEIKSAVDAHIDTHQPSPPEPAPVFDFSRVYANRRQTVV